MGAADCLKEPEGTLMVLAYASSSRSLLDYNIDDIYDRDDAISAVERVMEIIDDIMSYESSDIGKKFNHYDENFSEEENKISMIMKIIQEA